MKYLIVVLLASAALAAPSVEDEIVDSDIESAQFMMNPMGPSSYLMPMMNQRSYSSGCINACPCVQRCVVMWWIPCNCWCPPPCDDNQGTQPTTTSTTTTTTTTTTTPTTTTPEFDDTTPGGGDCNTCTCVWMPCTIWWMCRPRCPSTCCAPRPPPQPCCNPCRPCTSWPCSPCNNPCNNPCPDDPKKEIQKEKEPERPVLNEWRERIRNGLDAILAPQEPEDNWWDQPQVQPPRPPMRRP